VSGERRPTVRLYHPATFLERGVAIPFTTPLLYGTRARPSERHGSELIIPNPSGGRGVYVLAWPAIAQLCQPTLHDQIFNEHIAALVAVTPATIRRVAREIAMEGLAGEAAMKATATAIKVEANDRIVANFQLLMRLVDQAATSPAPPFAKAGPKAPDPARRAQLAVEWAALRIGRPATWVAKELERLADVLTPVGTTTNDAQARLPRLLTRLRAMRHEIDAWSENELEEDLTSHGHVVCTLADLTLALGHAVLSQAQDLMTDMLALLERWGTEQDSVVELATRPEWLLDGWEQVCMIWADATDEAARRAAVAEIVGLTPVLPKEVEAWHQGLDAVSDLLRFRRLVPLNEDWRTGVLAFKLVERNERFRALAA
jgi:hypothetical protein